MRARRSEERLAEAVTLYYVEGLTQEAVASRLGTSRSNVSRMLQTARDRRIIEFKVRWPLARAEEVERRLLQAFPLDEAQVLAHSSGGDVGDRVGELAARWLLEQVKDGQTIALSWGRALHKAVGYVETTDRHDVEVVQLGGDLQLAPHLSGHDLIRDLAARLGGRYSYLHAPAMVQSAGTAQRLRATPQIADQLAKARMADLALVGVGAYGLASSQAIVAGAGLSEEQLRRLEEAQPVGDICARFYGSGGVELDSPLRERVLALELDELSRIPRVAAVAWGQEKARAVLGGLRGRRFNVLVCDEALATAALQGPSR